MSPVYLFVRSCIHPGRTWASLCILSTRLGQGTSAPPSPRRLHVCALILFRSGALRCTVRVGGQAVSPALPMAPASPRGHGGTEGFPERLAFWKHPAGAGGCRREGCQYMNNWPAWTSWYKLHIDPPAAGLTWAVWSSPCPPLQTREAGFGGSQPSAQPPPLSLLSQPSRILLKYFKTI